MNAQQIKNRISITDFLTSNGIEPQRRSRGYWLYRAPYRQDRKPSFSVDLTKNKWLDFSTGQGGDLIDLVKLLHGADTSTAIEIISGKQPESCSFIGQDVTDDGTGVTIKHIQPLQNRALIQYLNERCIPVSIAKKYLKEAYYTTGTRNQQYFSLAFQNDNGGYALRNRYSKTAVSPAYFTTIEGIHHRQLNIFEGFMDFLSALAYFRADHPKFDCLVLNSTAHLHKIGQIIAKYERLNLFLDNDPAGKAARKSITDQHQHYVDFARKIYPDHKDFNAYLMDQKNSH